MGLPHSDPSPRHSGAKLKRIEANPHANSAPDHNPNPAPNREPANPCATPTDPPQVQVPIGKRQTVLLGSFASALEAAECYARHVSRQHKSSANPAKLVGATKPATPSPARPRKRAKTTYDCDVCSRRFAAAQAFASHVPFCQSEYAAAWARRSRELAAGDDQSTSTNPPLKKKTPPPPAKCKRKRKRGSYAHLPLHLRRPPGRAPKDAEWDVTVGGWVGVGGQLEHA